MKVSCDNCQKEVYEEYTSFSSFESNRIGDGTFCWDCTHEADMGTCDLCEEYAPGRSLGEIWVCEACEEHVLG